MPFSIQFLGAGGAFALPTGNATDLGTCLMQSNMVITAESGKKMLFDCGSYISFSANMAELGAADFDAVYVSHAHADHCGGLEWLALNTFFNPTAMRPKLFAVAPVLSEMRTTTYAGLAMTTKGPQTFEGYFETQCVNTRFIWEGLEFNVVPMVHVEHESNPMMSYGVVIDDGVKRVWISGNVVFNGGLINDVMQKWDVDMMFHDCETTGFHTGVHAHYEELLTLSSSAKAMMWLYHYDRMSAQDRDVTGDGFAGFVCPRQTFEF